MEKLEQLNEKGESLQKTGRNSNDLNPEVKRTVAQNK